MAALTFTAGLQMECQNSFVIPAFIHRFDLTSYVCSFHYWQWSLTLTYHAIVALLKQVTNISLRTILVLLYTIFTLYLDD